MNGTTERGLPVGAAPPFDAVHFALHGVVLSGVREPAPLPGTLGLVQRLRTGGVRTALLVTGGADGPSLPPDLTGRFDLVVDGAGIDTGSAGNGERVLDEALRGLDVAPRRVAVVAADPALVRAGRDRGFGLVAGIEWTGRRRALEAAGADVVLTDVTQLDLGVLRCDPWTLAYAGFDPAVTVSAAPATSSGSVEVT